MCDQYDNRGCEVVDELETTIANYEDEIKELKSELETKDLELQELKAKLNPKEVEFEDSFDYDVFASAWGRY